MGSEEEAAKPRAPKRRTWAQVITGEQQRLSAGPPITRGQAIRFWDNVRTSGLLRQDVEDYLLLIAIERLEGLR